MSKSFTFTDSKTSNGIITLGLEQNLIGGANFAIDTSGNGNDATLINSPTTTSNSIIFDGINQSASINMATATYSNTYTLEFKTRFLTLVGLDRIFSEQNLIGFGLFYFESALSMNYGSFISTTLKHPIVAGGTYAITITVDGVNTKLYIDGIFKNQQAINVTFPSTFVNAGLSAKLNNSFGPPANQEVFYSRFYSRALSDAEVLFNFNNS